MTVALARLPTVLTVPVMSAGLAGVVPTVGLAGEHTEDLWHSLATLRASHMAVPVPFTITLSVASTASPVSTGGPVPGSTDMPG